MRGFIEVDTVREMVDEIIKKHTITAERLYEAMSKAGFRYIEGAKEICEKTAKELNKPEHIPLTSAKRR